MADLLTKRLLASVFVLVVVVILTVKLPNNTTHKVPTATNALHDDKPMTSDYVVDYIPEDVAMKQLPPCVDHKLAADLKKSKISIQGNDSGVYQIGDHINVAIKLYDYYGKPLNTGGAILRARMFNLSRKAYATAQMTDHGDGSYTAQFEAFWAGKSTIKVKIAYTTESIKAMYNIRQKLPGAMCIWGTFSVGSIKESTLCYPTRDAFKHLNYSKICNLTAINSGMPWYCGKPRNVNLLCEDWTDAISRCNPKLPFTPCDKIINSRIGKDINTALEVHVSGENTGDEETLTLPQSPCKDFKVASLWTRKLPTGFMYKNTWHLRHCKGLDSKHLFSCLQNRTFLLFGDSTMRQWYMYVRKRWICNQTTAEWTTYKWHRPSACENRMYNFTVEYYLHSEPMSISGPVRYSTSSIARYIDRIDDHERVVVAIGLFVHCTPYHHTVFRRKIHIIRLSVASLLRRNPFAKVFIKGPHTYSMGGDRADRFLDYYGFVYRHIMFDEFTGLHDKVVFLDYSDITNALAVKDVHPPDNVVGAMVNQMLSYMC